MRAYAYYPMHQDFGPAHLILGALMVLFWVALIILVIRLLRGHEHGHQFGLNRHNQASPEAAMSTAKRRYAAGEITRDEFTQIKEDLAD